MIHQHFKLVDVFSAAENIALGLSEGGMVLDRKALAAKIREICDKYGFEVDPDQKVYQMSVSQKQTLEIVKVLYRGTDILILDEPTAVLTPQETEKLFAVLRNMKADGKSVIIITHKLHEVMAVSDRVAVLRKGEFIGDVPTAETNPQELTNMMVGHQVSLNIDRPAPEKRPAQAGGQPPVGEGLRRGAGAPGRELHRQRRGDFGHRRSISGCGQKELLEAIAGLQSVEPGSSISYLEDDGSRDELVGMNPGRSGSGGGAVLRPRGPAGHGPGGET